MTACTSGWAMLNGKTAVIPDIYLDDRIPHDAQISVLTQAREDLISRTAESLVGTKRANIHMYNATAELFRRVVFNVDESQCIAMATRGTELVMKYADQYLGDTEFGYQYSPEIFTQTPTATRGRATPQAVASPA